MNAMNHGTIVKKIVWVDEAATKAFATTLGNRPFPAATLMELRGDLGAGKTTFVRHLLAAFGVHGRVKSPTYAVVEPYTLQSGSNSGMNIWHFDFYRFNDPREWEEAGFRDIFASPGLKLVEWPDKAGDYLPQADLVLAIEVLDNDTRLVTLTAETAVGKGLLS